MSTTPADPPLPSPAPPPDWTTSREVALDCGRCGAAYRLSYKYRFAEGLTAARLRCPAPGCGCPREYYLPVNGFDVTVALVTGGPPRGRSRAPR